MICCNKCGSVIIEPKEEKEDEAAESKGRYKKAAAKEEAPIRRASLMSMPTSRIVNGFSFEDVDLCEVCKKFLVRQVNEVKFKFITENYEADLQKLLKSEEKGNVE